MTKCAPVMNTGVRFFRFNIILPSVFLSNLELLIGLTSELALSFNTVVRINDFYYAKMDVFLSICANFLKSWVELSLLLSYNPLEMVVNIMQPDFEGLGIWPSKSMSLFAGIVHTQSHLTSLSVLKACNRHPVPLSLLAHNFCSAKLGWRAASHNLYSRDEPGIDIDSIDINVTDQIS